MAKARGGFAPGDIVELKSGGPKMTVKDAADDGEWRCQWFAGKKLEEGWFDAASLKKVSDDAQKDDTH
jgi:uncharacterized protein YodC (DUF2158 family)